MQADQKRLKKDIEEKKRRKQVLDQQVKKQMQDVLVLNDEISEKRRPKTVFVRLPSNSF